MADWLQTIATMGFGALLAWLAAFVERKSSHAHEERKLKREKAEQAFIEIGAFERSAMQLLLWAMSVRTFEGKPPRPDPFDRARLTGLISMYFPEGIAVLEQHNAKAADIITANYRDRHEGLAAKPADDFEATTAAVAIQMQALTGETAKQLRQVVQKAAGPAIRLTAEAAPPA